MRNLSLLKALGLSTLLCVSAAAQASITVFTTEASFLAAVTSPGTDSFDDLDVAAAVSFDSPVDRVAGMYTYTASVADAGGASSEFFPTGTPADPWLSTFNPSDTITFHSFSNGVQAVGGLFFASDFDGAAMTGETILITATDASGSVLETIIGTSATSFRGFVSTGPLSSLTISTVQSGSFPYPTVNNLVLASPVPEPGTLVLLLAGIAAIGLMARFRPA